MYIKKKTSWKVKTEEISKACARRLNAICTRDTIRENALVFSQFGST